MSQCPRCKFRFRTPPDEEDGHPCPECGWEPGFATDRHTPGCPGGNCDCDVEFTEEHPGVVVWDHWSGEMRDAIDDDNTWVED